MDAEDECERVNARTASKRCKGMNERKAERKREREREEKKVTLFDPF